MTQRDNPILVIAIRCISEPVPVNQATGARSVLCPGQVRCPAA